MVGNEADDGQAIQPVHGDQEENECKCCLLVLIGLPGVGKSTLARNLASTSCRSLWTNNDVEVQYICTDDLIGNLPTNEDTAAVAEQWRQGRQASYETAAKALLRHRESQQKENSQHRKLLLIIDDNAYYRSMRYPFFQLAREHRAAYSQLLVLCNLDVALERNAKRCGDARVPEAIIERMSRRLEQPQPSTFCWEKHTITIDTNGPLNHEAVGPQLVDEILRHWEFPSPPPLTEEEKKRRRKEGSEANAKSIMHSLDLSLRKSIGSTLKSVSSIDKVTKAALVERLNGERKAIIHRLKHRTENQEEVRSLAGAAAQAEQLFENECEYEATTLLLSTPPEENVARGVGDT